MARKALTLLEVLIAIFIMGVGMLCVLAIFPVAAFMMGQSIQNYRVNDAVINTENLSEGYLKELITQNPNLLVPIIPPRPPIPPLPPIPPPPTFAQISPFFTTSQLVNPASNNFYPLMNPKYFFLDQYAVVGGRNIFGNIRAAAVNIFTADDRVIWNYPTLRRTSSYLPPYLGNTESLVNERIISARYFTLNTDTDIDESGSTGSGGTINRTGAYTISYLWENSNPLYGNTPTRRHMLVFKNRSELFPDFDNEIVARPSNPVSEPTLVHVPGQLDYKKGNWIMAQYIHPQDSNALQILKVSFHKIVAMNERSDSTGSWVELELQPKMNLVTVPPYQPSHGSANPFSEFTTRPIAVTTAAAPLVPSIGINRVFLLNDVVRVVDLGN